MCVARSSLLEALILAYFFGFIDRTVEDMTGNRSRERGSGTGQESNPGPLQRGQGLCTGDGSRVKVLKTHHHTSSTVINIFFSSY